MSNHSPMTLEAAAANPKAFVRVHNMRGRPHAAPAQIIGVEGKSVLVQIAGADRPQLVDPKDLQFWKSRNVASNIEIKPPQGVKAQPITPAPEPKALMPLDVLFRKFEESKAALDEYNELEALCRADLDQATAAATAAAKQVDELRKQIRARVDV